MAQNNYGMKIIGGVAFAFALIFIVEFISVVRKKDKIDVYTLIEPVCLFFYLHLYSDSGFFISGFHMLNCCLGQHQFC